MPEPVTPWRRAPLPRPLVEPGDDPVQGPALRGPRATGSPRADRGPARAPAHTWRSPSSTSPRRSSRRSASRAIPAAASSPPPSSASAPTSNSSARRCTGPSVSRSSATEAEPAARAVISVRAAVWPRLEPVPGGSTRSRPRAGVEQYSRATQSASSTSSGETPASSAAIARPSAPAAARCSATSTTTPSRRWRPERDLEQGPDADLAEALGEQVVERTRGRAGGSQRLDPAIDIGAAVPARRRGPAVRLAPVAPKLHPGERVLYEGHPSWRAILDFYLKGIAATRRPRSAC